MDTAILTEALDSPELFQSVLDHFPSDLIEAELALLSQPEQLRFRQLQSRLTAHELAARVRRCASWAEVSAVLASDPMYNQEAMALLTDEEKERIKRLKTAAAMPLDPKSGSLVGKRIYVNAGNYRTAGEGIVECDRGFGTLRMLEVRMPNGRLQLSALSDVREVT
jgi:hypothetical protein